MRRSRTPDAVSLAFAVAVHGVLLLLVLERWQAPQPRTQTSDLALFDVGVPPPQPLPKPTHRLPRPASILPGGSRPAAAPPVVTPVEAAPQVPVFSAAQQWSVTSPIDDGDQNALLASATSDVGTPGHGADGTGTGTGNGVGPGPMRFARAEWIREPDFNEIERYLPSTARAQSITVSVELGCVVPKPGKPKRCWVISESPRGFGFGRAAVAMASTFRIRPIFVNDEAMDLPVRVPLLFRVAPHLSKPKP